MWSGSDAFSAHRPNAATVGLEHHLSRTFRKLGIRRRVELAGALGPALAQAA